LKPIVHGGWDVRSRTGTTPLLLNIAQGSLVDEIFLNVFFLSFHDPLNSSVRTFTKISLNASNYSQEKAVSKRIQLFHDRSTDLSGYFQIDRKSFVIQIAYTALV